MRYKSCKNNKSTIIFPYVPFRTYRQGMHDLKVWPDMLPDPSSNSTTPGKSKDHKDQMSKLAKVMGQTFSVLLKLQLNTISIKKKTKKMLISLISPYKRK